MKYVCDFLVEPEHWPAKEKELKEQAKAAFARKGLDCFSMSTHTQIIAIYNEVGEEIGLREVVRVNFTA